MQNITKHVINLKTRPDRRAEMQAQLKEVGWQAQFLNATRPDNAANFPSIGARGCFLSHLETLKRAANTSRHVLVMEDDLNFVPGFSHAWANAMSRLETVDWDIFYAAHSLILPKGIAEVPHSLGIQCAHFVLFNRKTVPFIVGELEAMLGRPAGYHLGGPMHIDGAYTTIRLQNPHIKTYAASPSLGYQRSSASDISTTPKWFDRISFLKPAMRIARKMKNRISHHL